MILLYVSVERTVRAPKCAIPFRYIDEVFVHVFIPQVRFTYAVHLIVLHFIVLIVFGEDY
jgi:hypothetical protein